MIKENKGVTLVVLIVTIIVLLILSGIVLYLLSDKGPIEHAKMAKFATEFRETEERIDLYAVARQMDQVVSQIQETKQRSVVQDNLLPTLAKVTPEEKTKIKKENPTLAVKMQQLSEKTVDAMNIYWVDKQKIDSNRKEQYIIDIDTRQLYQYEGRKIYNLIWHTLDKGVGSDETVENVEDDEIWDGWIRLTLYYPEGATEKKWRLGEEGETRYDENLMWQEYTGPILVRLRDVENVWIKYKLDGEEQIVAPNGRVAVDIQPDSYYPTMVEQVKINVYYDKNAQVKEYKIGNGPWREYQGEFYVTENTIVEARAKKIENISDSQGNVIGTQEVWGRDNVYIGNIGIEESDLSAPTLTRKPADTNVVNEVAKVEANYPQGATRKIYKINYGQEQEYTQDISVTSYGTHIIAYYYDAEGKRSKATQITINDTSNGETPGSSEDYNPNNPGTPGGSSGGSSGGSAGSNPTTPSYTIPKPNIQVTPSSVVDEVEVSILVPDGQVANVIYYKIGDGSYQPYTQGIKLSYNTTITAYYITDKGERSSTAYKRINNIREYGKPYVKIEATPDSFEQKYGVDKVNVKIQAQDADILEYSMNGITYQPYTSLLEITQNGRIYAKGTNAQGVTITYLDIDNIGGITDAPQNEKLSVAIEVSPEPLLTTQLIDKAIVTIRYDSRTKEKYYRIGENGQLKTYTEPFEVKENTIIYAYAINSNGKGAAQKQIDHLTTGISAPAIVGIPGNGKQAGKVKISIHFDRNASSKKYKINNGNYVEYTGEFEVDSNCSIIAYNRNGLGQQATSTYEVNNITKITTIVIDKGKYYIIKLNYPPNSIGREYKWQLDGEWKSYPEDGILLIKPEYRDEILNASGQVKIKIEDENGKLIDFKGDYYFVTKPMQELMENISMRWDRLNPSAPSILLNTTEPAREVTATIIYAKTLTTKQYKIVQPDGTTQGWKDYTEPIKITKNNTLVYARGQDEAEVWSPQGMKQVTNIDEEPPHIKVIADLKTEQQKVGLRIEVTDDTRVETVMWAKGIQPESYFQTNGQGIQNNSIVYVTENGYYTIYAKDGVGNTSTYTLQVGNVDLTPPIIQIQVTPEATIGTEVKIAITYGDSTMQQYKIGENNTTWSNYTEEIILTSYTVLAKNWKNTDNTVTVYGKGKDSAGNEQIQSYKILSLDMDLPKVPVIESNYGYPILQEYGISFDGQTQITYDTRTDIDNYYSTDNGKTWNIYTGTFMVLGEGNVIAKSIKKTTGLEVSVTRNINMPGDAIGAAAYDGNTSTYYAALTKAGTFNRYILIDPSMQGKSILLQYDASVYGRITAHFMNASNETISSTALASGGYGGTVRINIPVNTAKLNLQVYYSSGYSKTFVHFYEMKLVNEPVIKYVQQYPVLTQTKVEKGKEIIEIDYFPTSVEKLYKIGEDENWKDYQDRGIVLELGETIYAKGIDKYGIETQAISSRTAVLKSDALSEAAYDGNGGTYYSFIGYATAAGTIYKTIGVDISMRGKYFNLKGYTSMSGNISASFYNSNNGLISSTGIMGQKTNTTVKVSIPEGTTKITFSIYARGGSGYPTNIYEVTPTE